MSKNNAEKRKRSVEKESPSYIILYMYYKYGDYNTDHAKDEDESRSLLVNSIVEAKRKRCRGI